MTLTSKVKIDYQKSKCRHKHLRIELNRQTFSNFRSKKIRDDD